MIKAFSNKNKHNVMLFYRDRWMQGMALNKDLASYSLIYFSGHYLSKSLYLNDDILSNFHMINGNIYVNYHAFRWRINCYMTLSSGHGGIMRNRNTEKAN